MKILIFYASYGGGHLKAAESINVCILNNYKDKNIEVELIDCMKYVNKAIEKMTTAAYREMAKKMPWAWGKIYNDSQKGPLAHISSRSNKIINKIIVTEMPLSSKFLCKYDRNDVLKSFELKDNKFNILFFGGGEFGLGKTRTVEIFEEFTKFAKSRDFQVIGISGKNEKMKLAFENIVRENNCGENVKVLEFTNKVPELMSISDLVVTKPGGMTTTESLASRLPMIIINPIPGQEVENAEFLESKNIAIWLRKNDDVNEVLTNLFESPTKLKEMKQNTKLLANINSTRDICDILLK